MCLVMQLNDKSFNVSSWSLCERVMSNTILQQSYARLKLRSEDDLTLAKGIFVNVWTLLQRWMTATTRNTRRFKIATYLLPQMLSTSDKMSCVLSCFIFYHMSLGKIKENLRKITWTWHRRTSFDCVLVQKWKKRNKTFFETFISNE